METTSHPAAAAIDLIVSAGSRSPGTLRDVLGEYADELQLGGAFADLSEDDARILAIVIAFDVSHGGGAADLRRRADVITSGWWAWSSAPAAAAHAFTVAADVLDAL